MKIYTKTGDQGETGLYRGGRIRKDSLRISACGNVDETNCFIGIVRAHDIDKQIDEYLYRIQNHLFIIGADLSTPQEAVKPGDQVMRLEENTHTFMEQAIDDMEAQLQPLREFILPGGSICAAYLHTARSICRRAERSVVALYAQENVSPQIIIYLNRLSDFLFTTARYSNFLQNHSEIKWHKP